MSVIASGGNIIHTGSFIGSSTGGGVLAPYTGFVATRGRTNDTGQGTGQGYNSRTYHFSRDTITSLQVLWAGWFLDANGIESASGGTYPVTASIEYPVGTFTQILFSGGATGTVPNGGNIVSDVCVVSIPKDTAFYVRSFIGSASNVLCFSQFVVPSAQYYPIDVADGDACQASASDKTMGGTITDTTHNLIFPPLAIIGTTTRPSVLMIGDSRVSGVCDVYTGTSGDIGQFERSVGPNFAYCAASRFSGLASNMVSFHTLRVALAQYCTHVMSDFGIVDMVPTGSNQTAAQALASVTSIAGYFTGKPFYQATLPPITTSTDGFQTVANQTNAWGANDSRRTLFNSTVRGGGVVGVTGCIDITSAEESGLASGKWAAPNNAPYVNFDGIHEILTATLADVSAGLIPSSLFGPPLVPKNIIAPIVYGPTNSGGTLTVTNGVWTDSPSFTYQWFTSPSTVITGATSSTYVVQAGDIGNSILCKVTARGLAGTNIASSNTVGAITAAYVGPVDIAGAAITWYGLRAGAASYATGSNPCMDVTKASDGSVTTTINILSTGVVDIASIVALGYAVKVKKLYDQIGTKHLSQATLAAMPDLVLTGLNTLPVIMFSGAQSLSGTGATQAQPVTFSWVGRTSGSTGQQLFFNNNGGSESGLNFNNTNRNKWFVYSGGAAVGSIPATDDLYHAVQAVLNGASTAANVDAASVTVTGNPGTQGLTAGASFILGASQVPDQFLIATMTEQGVWAGDKTANFVALGTNQRAFWGF